MSPIIFTAGVPSAVAWSRPARVQWAQSKVGVPLGVQALPGPCGVDHPRRAVSTHAFSPGLQPLAEKIASIPLLSNFIWNDVTLLMACGIGVAVPLIAVGGGLVWWRTQKRLSRDVLELSRDKVVPNSSRELGSEMLYITRFMKLHAENVKLEPFNSVKMVSAADYAAALKVPGSFNWQRAANTALVHLGLTFLLPLTTLVIKHKEQSDSTDPLAAIGGSDTAYALLRDSLSPHHLYAIGELMNLVTASKHTLAPAERCVVKYLRGDGELPPGLREDFPEPFVLEEELPRLLEGLDPDAAPALVPAPEGPRLLPGVAGAHVGQPYTTNDFQVQCGLVFAILLNRLSANTMPDAWRPGEYRGKTTTVRVSRGGPDITTPGALISAMQSEMGASINMGIVTRVTSFGKGFALEQEGEWLQLPFVLPIRTGITMLDGVAESSGTKEITTLMPHAEMMLRVSAPTFSFRISFYQGIEGFTGWHAGREPVQPWNNSEAMELKHSSWSTSAEYAAAAEAASMVASATNRTADQLDLPNGGYGYLGVCHDSVAIVQAAMQEPVTLFPCLLAGQAEVMMSKMYKEIQDAWESEGQETRAALADQVKHAMLRTPCDVVHEPTSMHDAIRRVSACTPPVTPFQTLELCRGDLRRVAEQLDAVGIYKDKAEHAARGREAADVTHVTSDAAQDSGTLREEATAA